MFHGGADRRGYPEICPAHIAELRNFIHKRGTAGRTAFPGSDRQGCRWSCSSDMPDLYGRGRLQRGTAPVTKNSVYIGNFRATAGTYLLLFFRDRERQPVPAPVAKDSPVIGISCFAFRADLNHTEELLVFFQR
jgi:hypothetical protein